MNFIKRFKGILITMGISMIILAIGFYLPEQTKESVSENTDVPIIAETVKPTVEEHIETEKPTVEEHIETEKYIVEEHIETVKLTNTETRETTKPMPTPQAPLKTMEPTVTPAEKNTLSCTLTIRCDTVLNNMEKVVPEKVHLLPENGIILPQVDLEFTEGDTVFDVLEKELKNRKIHFEFSKVSMYDSVYIEGIGNLYEFDCGNLSGWLYRVNGKTPSVGCSQYKLQNTDKIEFLYTCNMGRDL